MRYNPFFYLPWDKLIDQATPINQHTKQVSVCSTPSTALSRSRLQAAAKANGGQIIFTQSEAFFCFEAKPQSAREAIRHA